MRRGTTLLAAIVMVLAPGLSGCGHSGKKVWPVSGKVTFQGKPVIAGTIRFSNPSGGVDMTAGLGPDGSYEIAMAEGRGLPEGDYQVAIIPLSAAPGAKMPFGPALPPPKPICRDIPEKYRSPSTSRLVLAVKPGANNRFDVDMRSP
jgi:hypothetical protein